MSYALPDGDNLFGCFVLADDLLALVTGPFSGGDPGPVLSFRPTIPPRQVYTWTSKKL